MPKFKIIGVDRESKLDTELVIDAVTAANAKAKAELSGVVVTDVTPAPPPPPEKPLFVSTTDPPPNASSSVPRPMDSTAVAFGVARGIWLAVGIFVLLMLIMVALSHL